MNRFGAQKVCNSLDGEQETRAEGEGYFKLPEKEKTGVVLLVFQILFSRTKYHYMSFKSIAADQVRVTTDN